MATTSTNKTPAKKAAKKTTEKKELSPIEVKRSLRKFKKKLGRGKRALKLKTDKEFAKTFFEARSKRSTDKKSTFRKKKNKKK